MARSIANFDRPAWLYRLGDAAPTGELRFRPPRPPAASDLALCQRLTTAYRLASSEAPPSSGMWADRAFEERQRELRNALTQGTPRDLFELLGSMFQSDFVLGLAPGSLVSRRQPKAMKRLLWLAALNKLVALAESLGTVRTENPEQGRAGHALRQGGVESVVRGVEERLGLSLDFPDVGAAYGLIVGERLITPESSDQLYGAARLRDVIATYVARADDVPRVVEIGGGYGAMAYWLLQMMDARYAIVDLPLVGVLQGYFLAQALGHESVSLHGEPPARVMLVPDHALESVPSPFDALVNKDSLPEIPVDAALAYLEWARVGCRGVFYSNNHESAAAFYGVEQNVVCELVERVGGFTRVRRDASWVRRGYVEEVFLPGGATGSR